MLATAVWALDRGCGPKDALRWAVAAGAATASVDGTGVGSRESVEELMSHVQVEAMADRRGNDEDGLPKSGIMGQ